MIVKDLIMEIEGIFILLGNKPHKKALDSLEKHSPEALEAMRNDLAEEFEAKNPGKKVLTLQY